MGNLSEHRTQVYFPESLYRKIREYAKARRLSVAEVIRSAVAAVVEDEPTARDPLLDIVGAGQASGHPDASVEHDHYVYGTPKRSAARRRAR